MAKVSIRVMPIVKVYGTTKKEAESSTSRAELINKCIVGFKKIKAEL